MSSTPTTPVLVRLTPEQLAALDEWRRDQNDIPTRPEAIRRLIERGLLSQPEPK